MNLLCITDVDIYVSQDDLRRTRKKKKKTNDKVISNFYSAQIREAKRDQLALLREKFEKDKERVNKMKAARRFNPF